MSDPTESQEFDVIVHPLDDGSYWAEVCGLPGCLTQASSYTDILAHLRDAHETCLAAPAPALSAEASTLTAAALREARTAEALGAALLASGWEVSATGKFHHVFATFGRDERIAVPVDPLTILNDGYRAAIGKLLG